MLFITGFLILSFCFIFYIIWSQFLRKDTRLSMGLKILQKKMSLLEDFSQKTDLQLRKGIDLLDKKNRELEKIVNEARFCIFKMEKLILGFETSTGKKPISSSPKKKSISLVEKKEESPKKLSEEKSLSLIKNKKTEKAKFQFGESPFASLQFIESPKKEKKNFPSYDSSPDAN